MTGPGSDADPAPAPVLARVRDVHRSFGPVRALRGANLTVRAGEVVALVGENGSGKSSLAAVLAGTLRPDGGTVEVDGQLRVFSDPRDALRAGIGLVSQEPALLPEMSIAENVLLHRAARFTARTDRRALRRDAAAHLEQVGLGHLDPRLPLGSLGPGQRELVGVARALAARPRLLVLDEVTTRLSDPDRLLELVRALSGQGLGVVLVTHRLREIRAVAHRATVLRDGATVAELGPDRLSDADLTRAMVGREVTDYYPHRRHAPGAVRLAVEDLVTCRSPVPMSFTVHAGEVLGVAGLGGAGRSELLETLAGARGPRRGRVLLDGVRLPLTSVRATARRGVALVPEDRLRQALFPERSLTENLAVTGYRALRRVRHARDRFHAEQVAAAYRIRCDTPAQPVGTLSGGNAQKVVLGRAAARAPALLLLDEPTRGVDVAARADIYAALAELARGGTAVLLASSDLLELAGICHRVMVLCDGAVTGTVPHEEATEERLVRLAHGTAGPTTSFEGKG